MDILANVNYRFPHVDFLFEEIFPAIQSCLEKAIKFNSQGPTSYYKSALEWLKRETEKHHLVYLEKKKQYQTHKFLEKNNDKITDLVVQIRKMILFLRKSAHNEYIEEALEWFNWGIGEVMKRAAVHKTSKGVSRLLKAAKELRAILSNKLFHIYKIGDMEYIYLSDNRNTAIRAMMTQKPIREEFIHNSPSYISQVQYNPSEDGWKWFDDECEEFLSQKIETHSIQDEAGQILDEEAVWEEDVLYLRDFRTGAREILLRDEI